MSSQTMNRAARIADLTATLVTLGTEYRSARVVESDAMEMTRKARKEMRKFELRMVKCKTWTGKENNRALAEYQRCVIRAGEAKIRDARDEYTHIASEIARFKAMIAETEQGLTRRNANCDGPCTDAVNCNACVELENLLCY